MNTAQFLKMFYSIIGGLGIFMLGMKYMSDGLQVTAGDRLRNMISAVTNNRFLAVIIGTVVTCIIQSSSVTTVMVVGFVNSGFMTLGQAIGVTLGANIGTTITGWILVLKIGKYGLPILGIAALFYRFLRQDRWRYIALFAMGVGMIFFGLELMTNGFKPIRTMPAFEQWFHAFQADDYFGVLKCAFVGCVLTCIVQSSSATLGITIGLATAGVIPFHTAAALVLGENIGTTITAWLASLGTTTNAKRAAYAHVFFNVVGVMWITAIFNQYIGLLEFLYQLVGIDPNLEVLKAGDLVIQAKDIVLQNDKEVFQTAAGTFVEVTREFPHVTKGIALVHTCFNIVNVLIFLPFTRTMARALTRLVPDKPFKEAPHLTLLDDRFLETPSLAIEQSRVEILRMGENVKLMLDKLRRVIADGDDSEELVKKLFHREEVMDIMQKEVVVFLTELLSNNGSHEVAYRCRRQLCMADEYESVSDYIINILKIHLRLKKDGLSYPEAEMKGLIRLHDEVTAYFELVDTGYEKRHSDIISKAYPRADAITFLFRDLREQHLQHISKERVEPLISVSYTNSLNAYRRIKDHLLNFAEALSGQK